MHRKSTVIAILGVILVVIIGYVTYAAYTDRPPFSKNVEQADNKESNTEANGNATETKKDGEEKPDEAQSTVGEIAPYFVAIDDGGISGEKIGCNDSLVKQILDVKAEDGDMVKTAVNMLITNHNQNIGGSGLYNALHQSSLTFDSWSKADDMVTVNLSGELVSGGSCDDVRIIEQLEHTAATAAGVSMAHITVNGTPIEELLSGRE